MLASAGGALVAMLYTWITNGKPDAGMTANGLLAGLVGITAPSGFVTPLNAFIIGSIAGLIVPIAVWFFDQILRVDDPVGAISVHGVCGLWGQLAVGLFADGKMNYNGWVVTGLFYGDTGQLGAQVIGAVTCFVWAFGTGWLFFKALDLLMGIRVSAEDELAGLDLTEMGAPAYWDGGEPVVGAWPVPTPAMAAD
jgi:Amt family ammonium transporter